MPNNQRIQETISLFFPIILFVFSILLVVVGVIATIMGIGANSPTEFGVPGLQIKTPLAGLVIFGVGFVLLLYTAKTYKDSFMPKEKPSVSETNDSVEPLRANDKLKDKPASVQETQPEDSDGDIEQINKTYEKFRKQYVRSRQQDDPNSFRNAVRDDIKSQDETVSAGNKHADVPDEDIKQINWIYGKFDEQSRLLEKGEEGEAQKVKDQIKQQLRDLT
jgi:hypothetical protein